MSLLLLALEAALYPTLLAVVVLLLAQPRPVRLLGAYLAGGMITSVGIGCIVVFALDGTGRVSSQKAGLSWTADLAVGGLALLAAVALALRADERVRRRRAQPGAAAREPDDDRQEPWSQRLLSRGSVPLVFAAALVINVPGAAYLIALKDIAAGDNSTADAIALIVAFNLIMFSLAEIPLVGLIVAPERTQAQTERLNAWFKRHGRDIAVALCVILGGFLVVRGLVNS
ncbi:MAG TPA: GAP family protein [Solirubrobacteraceae bacterium]|nr:GAP family protein [Solirubrobacteraceae bacterium]